MFYTKKNGVFKSGMLKMSNIELKLMIEKILSDLIQKHNLKLKHGFDVNITPVSDIWDYTGYKAYICIDYNTKYIGFAANQIYFYEKKFVDELEPLILELREEQLILELAGIE